MAANGTLRDSGCRAEIVRYLNSDNFPARGGDSFGVNRGLDHHFASSDFPDARANGERRPEWRRSEVIDAQRRGDKAKRRLGAGFTSRGTIRGGGRRARRVAINERGNHSAVNKARNGDVPRLRGEGRNRFIPIPIRADVVAVLVQSPTAETMGEAFGVKILDRHDADSLCSWPRRSSVNPVSREGVTL